MTVVVEDSLEGHGVESEERSVLHVARSDGSHAARKFCSYDGIEAGRLIRGYGKWVVDEKNGEKRKGKGSCGRGARRRGRCGGRALGTRFIFHAATLTLAIVLDSTRKAVGIAVFAASNLVINALLFLSILDIYLPPHALENPTTIVVCGTRWHCGD